jgi:hypothetical protein
MSAALKLSSFGSMFIKVAIMQPAKYLLRLCFDSSDVKFFFHNLL